MFVAFDNVVLKGARDVLDGVRVVVVLVVWFRSCMCIAHVV